MPQQHQEYAALKLAAGLLAAVVTAGCGASLGPTTGSLFGGGQTATAATPAPAPVVEPTARALQVGAVSARASRCGFNFDPAKLKSAFLASEAKAGATSEQVQKIEREFEFTRLTVAQKIGNADDYCSDANAKQIKADLVRHLSGDFSPAQVKQVADDGGWFSSGYTSSAEKKPFGHADVFDPLTGKPKNSGD